MKCTQENDNESKLMYSLDVSCFPHFDRKLLNYDTVLAVFLISHYLISKDDSDQILIYNINPYTCKA